MLYSRAVATRLQTKVIRNQVLNHIKQLGLDPDQFYWDEVQSRYMPGLQVSKLCHKTEEYFYIFDYDDHNIRYSAIGIMSPGTDFSPAYAHLWRTSEHISAAYDWLRRVKRDIETPDLWSDLAKQKELLLQSTGPDIENIPFTKTESDYITKRLDEAIEQLSSDKDLPDEIKETLKNEFEYIKTASTRLGRKDWLMIFVALFQIIQAFALAPEATQKLFHLLYPILRELFRRLLSS